MSALPVVTTRHCNYCDVEHLLTKDSWYRLESYPRCKTWVKERRKANYDPDRVREYNKQYRKKNREKLNQANADWRAQNADRHRENARAWYRANRTRRIARHAEYCRERHKSDPAFRLARNLRGRLYRALKGISKTGSAVQELGCSVDELKSYLEAQFTPEMSWENYGTYWEVDHILPLANYCLTDRGTFRRLIHYTNLQPLTVAANRRKHNREEI